MSSVRLCSVIIKKSFGAEARPFVVLRTMFRVGEHGFGLAALGSLVLAK